MSITQLITPGESETLVLERSTTDLRPTGETLGAFLNGEDSHVLIGEAPDRKLVIVKGEPCRRGSSTTMAPSTTVPLQRGEV